MIPNQALNEVITEIQVNALLSGHDLTPFEPLPADQKSQYQAACRRCGRTVQVKDTGLCYSLLGHEDCADNNATAATGNDMT
jgi:hypothetical protein